MASCQWLYAAFALGLLTTTLKAEEKIVTCKSTRYTPKACELPDDITHVSVEHQLSHVPCIRDSTFSTRQNYLLVLNGCGANFRVTFGRYEQGGYDQGGGQGMVQLPRRKCVRGRVGATCYSDGTYETCPAPVEVTSIRLVHLANRWNPCEDGHARYYGIDQNRIYVTNGCGGKFEVHYKFCPRNAECSNFKKTVSCFSLNSLHRNMCRLDIKIRNLALRRKFSRNDDCIRDQTYFDNIDSVVVCGKCKALFEFDCEVCGDEQDDDNYRHRDDQGYGSRGGSYGQ